MECPRCNSKVMSNMQFCPFCGLEVENGKKQNLDEWLNYLNTRSAYLSGRMSDNRYQMIVSMGLIIGSIVSLVSFQSGIVMALSIVGILFGIFIFYWSGKNNDQLNLHYVTIENLNSGILMGRLATSKEISKQMETMLASRNGDAIIRSSREFLGWKMGSEIEKDKLQ